MIVTSINTYNQLVLTVGNANVIGHFSFTKLNIDFFFFNTDMNVIRLSALIDMYCCWLRKFTTFDARS